VTVLIRAADPDGVPPQALTYSFLNGRPTAPAAESRRDKCVDYPDQPTTGDYPIQLQVDGQRSAAALGYGGFTFFVRTQTIIHAGCAAVLLCGLRSAYR
jgi:hypothetical protein